MTKSSLSAVAFAALLAICAGCGDDEVGPKPPASYSVAVAGLQPLAPGHGHYEAWIAFPESEGKRGPEARVPFHGDNELISLGTFQVDAGGSPVELDGTPAAWSLAAERNPQFAAEAWISIEPEGDADSIPSGLLLAGEFLGTEETATSDLSAGYDAIFDLEDDLELESIHGTYELATYSDASPANEAYGIYWKDSGDPGLELPPLDGEKIVYEAWIAPLAGGDPISCGRFARPDSLDSDGAGFGDGGETPLVPCQEFLEGSGRRLDDGTYRTFVSIEPENDNDPALPTQFVLLADTIAAGTETRTAIAMSNTTAGFPTARVVIDR